MSVAFVNRTCSVSNEFDLTFLGACVWAAPFFVRLIPDLKMKMNSCLAAGTFLGQAP
jgi:hypothetical protein